MIDKLLEVAARVKYSPRIAPIRKLTNQFYYDPTKAILSSNKVKVIEMNGCKFWVNEPLEALRDMSEEPWLEGTRPDDVVLDLGAHIGIMCIPLAKKVKRVYALEPIYAGELQANIELNELQNVRVLETALGNGKLLKLWYHDRLAIVPTASLTQMREWFGPIDFLKSNCEGGEWFVSPWEYEGIRELRIDYHIGRRDLRQRMLELETLQAWLKREGYKTDIQYFDLGWNPQHKGRYQIIASKR